MVNSVHNSSEKELHESFKRNKQEFLLRKILDYQRLFSNLHDYTSNESYLFLDDLYHLIRKDQPDLIDYFHKIAKGNNLWIKIGTIRNRTTWYTHTPQPIGMKIGDDAEEINLDLTLEKFFISKDFLKSILNIYITESNAPIIDDILTDGALDRLVLSSGGVARDFLGLFRRSIEESRERLKKAETHHRGPKIGAEDVNVASGNYGESKKEEFQRDTLEDREKLEEAFNKIKTFCLDTLKRNIFLIDQDQIGEDIDLIQELIDLRLIHQIKSRVTVSSRPSKIYKAYLIDVSQYTGERTRRDVEMIEFWKESEKESLRRATGIYDPKNVTISNDINLTQTKAVAKKNDEAQKGQTKMDL